MNNELTMRCVLSRDLLPVTEMDQVIYALVDIKAGGDGRPESLPANMGLVLDRSGSMDGEKMDHLKEAVGLVAGRLGENDLVSVTVFDDQVETLIPGGTRADRGQIRDRLANVLPRGGTQISDGLRAGLAEVKKGLSKDRVNRVLLLTDGQTWDDEDACLALADEAGRDGIAITSIGLGEEWNEQLLLQLAERSHGNSHWIQNPVDIIDAFRQEVEGMQSVAAVNLKATVRMSPGIRPTKVYATVPMIRDLSRSAVNGQNMVADLGSLDSRRGQTLLIEARVPAQRAGKLRLGQVEITYDMPSRKVTGQSIKADLVVAFTPDTASAMKVKPEVMNLAEKVSAFKLQTRALTEAAAGDITKATRNLRSAATVLLDLGEEELAAAAEQEILSLKRTGALTSAGTKKLEYGTRKLTGEMTKAMQS